MESLADRKELLQLTGEVITFPLGSILAITGETYNNVSVDTSMISFDAIDYYFQVLEEDVITFQIGLGDIFTKTTEALTRTFKITNKFVDGYGWVKLVAVLVTSEALLEPPVTIEPNGVTIVQGLKGDKGDPGLDGAMGIDGAEGLSAYQVAVNNGFVGTESEWIMSLQGSVIRFTYSQAIPSDVWVINHNLGHIPIVTVFDTAESEVECDRTDSNINTLTLFASAPFAGTAYLL